MHQGSSLDRRQRFWMIAAGPGAGFAFLLLILALLCMAFNEADVISVASSVLFGTRPVFRSTELLLFLAARPLAFVLLRHFIWINFWWGILNLLPVMPLDGGHIADLLIRPQRRVYLVGTIAAGFMAATGFLWFKSLYTALLFGYLAWQNYQNMRAANWR